ncbi:MAG: nuclear transport factor 2 family protein [Bacteroidota bacterium]
MRLLLVLSCLTLFACNQTGNQSGAIAQTAEQEEQTVRTLVTSLNEGMARAFTTGGIDTDSLMDYYYERDIYYITPWGWSEPLDSTKSRIRRSSARIQDYTNRVENLEVKVYGDGAYASYIFRQNYLVNGSQLEEYLPTTVILERRGDRWKIVRMHRSTDYETFQQYIAMQQRQEAGQ